MRILASLRAAEGTEPIAELRRLFADHLLLPVEDPVERREVIKSLIEDMSESDRHRFQRTVRHVAQDPNGGTVASISVLPDRFLLIRMRNSTLQKLVPSGHRLMETIMHEHGPEAGGAFELHTCEVRERGNREGFLYGSWHGGESRFGRFLFSQRRATFIVALATIGLSLETLFSFIGTATEVGQLGLRLGAPMLVSALVLILERRAQWRDQLDPRLRWSTSPARRADDPFQLFPGDS